MGRQVLDIAQICRIGGRVAVWGVATSALTATVSVAGTMSMLPASSTCRIISNAMTITTVAPNCLPSPWVAPARSRMKDELRYPWSIVIDGDRIILTEAPGSIAVIRNGQLQRQAVRISDPIVNDGGSGLLGMVLAPDFPTSRVAGPNRPARAPVISVAEPFFEKNHASCEEQCSMAPATCVATSWPLCCSHAHWPAPRATWAAASSQIHFRNAAIAGRCAEVSGQTR